MQGDVRGEGWEKLQLAADSKTGPILHIAVFFYVREREKERQRKSERERERERERDRERERRESR